MARCIFFIFLLTLASYTFYDTSPQYYSPRRLRAKFWFVWDDFLVLAKNVYPIFTIILSKLKEKHLLYTSTKTCTIMEYVFDISNYCPIYLFCPNVFLYFEAMFQFWRQVIFGIVHAAQWAIFGVKLMCQDKVKSKKVEHWICYFYTSFSRAKWFIACQLN